jgi:hypothetical protein
MKLTFFSDCVQWPLPVDELKRMIADATDITRKTFLSQVDPEEMRRLEKDLGYEEHPSQGLTMAKDWHVSYHKSTLRGCPAVYFVWSATEFVFTDLACLEAASKS